jgi:hypothetical protein
MNEQEARNEMCREINRRAPHLKIVAIGRLFGPDLDAVVEHDWGQCMWSVYVREMNPQPPEPAPAALPGQLSMF